MLCFDIQYLTAFNNVSMKLGDLAILEEASRLDKAAREEMLVMRIGGDEFALITGLKDREAAHRLSKEILALNGQEIAFEGKSYPLSLYCGVTMIPESLRYSEFFTDMHNAIIECKNGKA